MGNVVHLHPQPQRFFYRGWTIEQSGRWFRYSDGARRDGWALTVQEAVWRIDDEADAVDLPPLFTLRDAASLAALALLALAAILLLGG